MIPVGPGGTPEVDALRMEVERLRKALEKSEKLPNPKKADEGVTTPAKTSRVTVLLPAAPRAIFGSASPAIVGPRNQSALHERVADAREVGGAL